MSLSNALKIYFAKNDVEVYVKVCKLQRFVFKRSFRFSLRDNRLGRSRGTCLRRPTNTTSFATTRPRCSLCLLVLGAISYTAEKTNLHTFKSAILDKLVQIPFTCYLDEIGAVSSGGLCARLRGRSSRCAKSTMKIQIQQACWW